MRRVIRDIGAILFYGTPLQKTLFFQKSLSHKAFSYPMLSSHRQHYLQSLISALNSRTRLANSDTVENLSSHRPLNRLSVSLSLLPHGRNETDRWWNQWGSNPQPPACRAGALPVELWPHTRLRTIRELAPRLTLIHRVLPLRLHI